MTSKLSAKFMEIFRNLKSDAVPRPPRQNSTFNESESTEQQNDNTEDNYEEIFVNHDGKKSKKKPKFKKSYSVPNKESEEVPEEEDRRSSTASNSVNTQAGGNVINILNSSKVRWGNDFVYYMGNMNQPGNSKPSQSDDEEQIEKTDIIIMLLEADIKPEPEYIDYISNHLGKNWHRFFRKLGYKQGQIETAEIDKAKEGVAEARYKLLLDWIRNDDDGTLGKLSNVLWEDGERQIVKDMADMYNAANR